MEPAFSLKHIGGKSKAKNNTTDTSAIPSTAYDYLRHVQNEAANCPDIVVANMDCSVFNANQDSNFTALEPIKTSIDNKAPSAKWQNEQVSAFSEIRQFLAHQKALLKKKKVKKRKLPAAENESEWFQFCFGEEQEASTIPHEKETENVNSSIQNDAEHNGGTPALLSIICQMNQSTVLTVLDHHISWLESQPFTLLQFSSALPSSKLAGNIKRLYGDGLRSKRRGKGQWIYALLTAVEKPLLPDTTYSLRTLARLCSKQKENLTPEQTDEMAALYLIITLVMRYFGQSDLARPV